MWQIWRLLHLEIESLVGGMGSHSWILLYSLEGSHLRD